MEVIVIEHEAFKRLESMFIQSQEIIKELTQKINNSKTIWLDIKQVCELTRYHKNTILARKDEIGYRTIGRDLHFKLSAVEKWMDKYYRSANVKYDKA